MAKLGAAVDYDPFKVQPAAEAKLGAAVDFDPFEQANPPDEQELNLPPLQGTPAPGVPLPPARPADIPLPIPRPANLNEAAPVTSPLQASIVPSAAALTGNAPAAPVMPGVGFGGAPATPPTGNEPGFAAAIPGGLQVKKELQEFAFGKNLQTNKQIDALQKKIDALKAEGGHEDEIDNLQRTIQGLTTFRAPENLVPELAAVQKTEEEIKAQPQTDFSKQYAKARQAGGIKDWITGTYSAIKADPLGASKGFTATTVEGAPQVIATVAGGVNGAVTGALYGAGRAYNQALLEETKKYGWDGDPKKFYAIYRKHEDEIDAAATAHAAVAGTFNAAMGLIPGGNTLGQGVRNVLFGYTPIQVAQNIVENRITTVNQLDPKTGQPVFDADGNPVLVHLEGLKPSEIADMVAQGIITSVPFEARHLLPERQAPAPAQPQAPGAAPPPGAGAAPPPGGPGGAKPGAGPEAAAPPPGPTVDQFNYRANFNPRDDTHLIAGFEDDIKLGRMTREEALDRVAKMTPEEVAQRADLFRQVGGAQVNRAGLSEADDLYLQAKRKELGNLGEPVFKPEEQQAPGAQFSPDESVEARGAGAAPPPPGAVDEPTARILKGAGYSAEDIMAMSPNERAAELRKARESRTAPADLTDEDRATLFKQPAQAEAPPPPPPEAPAAAAPEAPATKGTELVAQGVSPLEAMKEAAAPAGTGQDFADRVRKAQEVFPSPQPEPAPAPKAAKPFEPKTYGDIIGPNRYEPNNGFTLFPNTAGEAHFRFDTYKDYNSIGMGRNNLLGEPAKFTSDKDTDRRSGVIRPNEMLDKLKDPVLADIFTKFVNKEITKEQFLEQLSKTPIKANANPLPPEAPKMAAEPKPALEPTPEPTPEPVATPEPQQPATPTATEQPRKPATMGKPITLGQLVKRMGGIKEGPSSRGELKSRNIGFPYINNKTGATIEQLVHAAVEGGEDSYYPEWYEDVLGKNGTGVTNDMIKKFLDDFVSKRDFRSPEDMKALTEERLSDEQEHYLSQYKEDIRDLLKDMDHTASDELVRDAAVVMLRGEKDPLQALELAHMGRVAELMPNEGDSIRDITGENFWNTVQQHLIDKEEEAPRETEQRPTPEAGPAPREEGQPVEKPTAEKELEGRGKPVEEARPEKPVETPVSGGKEIPGTGLFVEKKKVKLSPKLQIKKNYSLLSRYFTPGRIVNGYGGKDKVVSYNPPDKNGSWSVTVQRVDRSGELDPPRNHSTMPDGRDIKEVLGDDVFMDHVVRGDLVKNKALLDKLGFEPVRTVDGVQQRVFIGTDPTEAIKAGLQPTVEVGAEGKPQTVIPGAEKISEKEQAQRGAEKGLKPKVEQKEPGGLFGDEAKQKDMMDLLKEQPKAPVAPEPPAPIQMPTSYKSWMAGPDQFSKSPNMPEEYFNVLKEWAKMLGLKGKIHLLLDKDIRGFNLAPYNQQTIFRRMKGAHGLRTWFPSTRTSIITLKLHPRKSFNLEILAHELGHTFEKEVFERASPEEKEEIIKDYKQFLREQKTSNIEQYIKALRNHVTAKLTTANIRSKDAPALKNLTPYWRSFSEYFADQISKYMMSEKRPQSVIGKFFGRIADGLKRLYQSLAGMQGKARKSIKDYLDRRINDVDPIIDASEMPLGGEPEEPTTEESKSSIGPLESLRERFNESELGRLLKYGFLDKYNDIADAQKAIEEMRGSPLPEAMDANTALNVYNDKVVNKQSMIYEREIQPLLDALKKAKISDADFAEFAYAQHAPYRNEMMARRNPEFQDGGGSGMTDEEAAKIIDEFRDKGQLPEMERLFDKYVRRMMRRDLENRYEAGLITKDEYEQLSQDSDFGRTYVPLTGYAEEDSTASKDTPKVGRGFAMRGKEYKSALGRQSLARNPLLNAIQKRMDGVVRVEKSEVNKTLYRLVNGNPDFDGAKIISAKDLPQKKVLGADGIVRYVPDTSLLNKDTTLPVKIGGVQSYISFNDENPNMVRFVKLIKNLGSDGGTVLKSAMALTRIYSKINTSWVPDFFLTHFPRTILDAILAGEADKKGLSTKIMGEMPNAARIVGKAMLGIPLKVSEARLYNEWRTSGAKFDYGGFETVARMAKKIQKEMRGITGTNESGAKKAARSMIELTQSALGAIEHLNQFFEHIVRFATFSALRKDGYPTARAATMAEKGTSLNESARLTRDIPVDYRKQGAFMPYINAAKPFTSVTVGTARTFYRVLASPQGRKGLFAITALSVLTSMLGLLTADKDKEDPTKSDFYTGIRGSERQKNIVLPFKNSDGEYLKIANGFLLIPSWVLGDQLVGVATGQVKPSDAAVNVISSLATAYDQIPNIFGEKSIIHQLAPLGIDGLIDTYYNKNMYGQPIYPEPREGQDALPHSEQYLKSTSETSKEVAKLMNSLIGGNAYKKGMLDMYPGNIDYWTNYLTGVSGTFAKDSWNAISNAINGIKTPYEKMPFARRLVTKAAGVQESEYYDMRNDILNKQKIFNKAYSDYQDDKTDAVAKKQYNDLKAELHMGATGTEAPKFSLPTIVKNSDKKISDLKDQIDTVQSNDALSAADRANQVKALKQKIADQMIATRRIIADKMKNTPPRP